MHKKRILAITSFLSIGASLVLLIRNYFQWKRKLLHDLESQSTVVDTTLGTIEYAMQGSGPAVLFAHGTPAGYDQSLAMAHMLKSERFTYIAVSRPGYLRTPLHQRSPAAQADLYAALLDKVGIQKTVIIGTSGGGPSALQFALRHPERCSGLIMLCGVSQHYIERPASAALPPPLQTIITPLFERFVSFSNPAIFLLDTLLHCIPYPLIPAGFVPSLSMPQLRASGYANDVKQFDYIDVYPLERITAPTLVLHGSRDTIVPMQHAEFVASRIPHAKLVIDEGGDHRFYVTHRKKIVPIILSFLSQLLE